MGSWYSAPRFVRLPDNQAYDEKLSQNLSFEMHPTKNGENDPSVFNENRRGNLFLHRSPSRNMWMLVLLFLALMSVTVVLTSLTTVFAMPLLMKGIFITKNEFNLFTEKLDSVEKWYNDTLQTFANEIIDLKEKQELILSAQVDIKNDMEHLQNCTVERSGDILELLRFNISLVTQEIGVMKDGIQQANKQFSTMQKDTSLSGRLDQLQRKYDSINTEIHRPVNLYKHCKEVKDHCSIDPDRTRQYWRDCATMYLPLKEEGWETIHYQCMYHSSSTENMEVLTPFEDNGKLRCDCDVTYPGDHSERHNPVSTDIHATCTLTILRCPLSQSVFE